MNANNSNNINNFLVRAQLLLLCVLLFDAKRMFPTRRSQTVRVCADVDGVVAAIVYGAQLPDEERIKRQQKTPDFIRTKYSHVKYARRIP